MTESCPMTPKAEFERQLGLLRVVKSIAVVGMSPKPDRPSYEVGLFLRDRGYSIIPIHPAADSIEGMKVFRNLTDALKACGSIDLVDLFVAGERTDPYVEEAGKLGLKRVWFQPGAENPKAEAKARSLGMETVSGACTMAVLKRAG